MCDLVDKNGFKFAKLKRFKYDFTFWNFKRPLSAPSPSKMAEKDRTLKGSDSTPQAGGERIVLAKQNTYFLKGRN